jgi:hypothetical protein
MRYVLTAVDPEKIEVSMVKDGDAFEYGGRLYIRPCRFIVDQGFSGINLEGGTYISRESTLVIPRPDIVLTTQK